MLVIGQLIDRVPAGLGTLEFVITKLDPSVITPPLFVYVTWSARAVEAKVRDTNNANNTRNSLNMIRLPLYNQKPADNRCDIVTCAASYPGQQSSPCNRNCANRKPKPSSITQYLHRQSPNLPLLAAIFSRWLGGGFQIENRWMRFPLCARFRHNR